MPRARGHAGTRERAVTEQNQQYGRALGARGSAGRSGVVFDPTEKNGARRRRAQLVAVDRRGREQERRGRQRRDVEVLDAARAVPRIGRVVRVGLTVVIGAVIVQRDQLDAAADEVPVIGAVTEQVQRGDAEKREDMRKNAERDDSLIGPQTAQDFAISVPVHWSRQ